MPSEATSAKWLGRQRGGERLPAHTAISLLKMAFIDLIWNAVCVEELCGLGAAEHRVAALCG